MYNGNTAIVSMQYSFLPSWLSFLVDKENARHAGQALFEAVDKLVRQMPEAQRPKLVVFGESLGSFGGEAPFMSLNNVLARTDGALFSGPTFNNTVWTDLTATRDRRFAGVVADLPRRQAMSGSSLAPSDLQRPNADWGQPRVVYLQHASDPIAWWTPDLLFAKPDWLREKRGYDVLPADAVDPGGDVPASLGRHGGGRRCAGRAWPPATWPTSPTAGPRCCRRPAGRRTRPNSCGRCCTPTPSWRLKRLARASADRSSRHPPALRPCVDAPPASWSSTPAPASAW